MRWIENIGNMEVRWKNSSASIMNNQRGKVTCIGLILWKECSKCKVEQMCSLAPESMSQWLDWTCKEQDITVFIPEVKDVMEEVFLDWGNPKLDLPRPKGFLASEALTRMLESSLETDVGAILLLSSWITIE